MLNTSLGFKAHLITAGIPEKLQPTLKEVALNTPKDDVIRAFKVPNKEAFWFDYYTPYSEGEKDFNEEGIDGSYELMGNSSYSGYEMNDPMLHQEIKESLYRKAEIAKKFADDSNPEEFTEYQEISSESPKKLKE